MKIFKLTIVFVLVLSVFSLLIADDFSSWQGSSNIILNTNGSAANIPSDIENIFIKVELTQDNFEFSEAKDDGSDLRFVSSNGTALLFKIDSWDKAGKKAEIVVLVPTILANNSTQFITMYWGNSSATALNTDASAMKTETDLTGIIQANNDFKIVNKVKENSNANLKDRWMK